MKLHICNLYFTVLQNSGKNIDFHNPDINLEECRDIDFLKFISKTLMTARLELKKLKKFSKFEVSQDLICDLKLSQGAIFNTSIIKLNNCFSRDVSNLIRVIKAVAMTLSDDVEIIDLDILNVPEDFPIEVFIKKVHKITGIKLWVETSDK